MIRNQYGHSPKNYAIASIIIYNMTDTPFNRDSPGGRITAPHEKLAFIKETISGFLEFDPGISLEYFVIINADTDCSLTKEYYAEIHGTQTKFGTTIHVLDAPDEKYPGPFASRQALYHSYPNFRYYFSCDQDCTPMKHDWYKDGITVMCKDDEIGILGAWISTAAFPCPSHITYTDINGKKLKNLFTYYNAGFFSFIRGHIFKLFDQYWGEDWFSQGENYRDHTVYEGELMFAHRIQQLGYRIADFDDNETDAPLAWQVPDVLFPNKTVGSVFPDPQKSKISPFFHTLLKMRLPHKWKLLTERGVI